MAKKDFAIVKNKPAPAPPEPSGPPPAFLDRVAQLEYQNLRQQVATITLNVARVVAERDATKELVDALRAENEKLRAEIATLKGGKG